MGQNRLPLSAQHGRSREAKKYDPDFRKYARSTLVSNIEDF
jgi:hypothetical protein